MMPRQPSVPNFTTVSAMCSNPAIFSSCAALDDVVATGFAQLSDDFADILRAVSGGYKQSVVCLHHDQIMDPDQRNDLPRRVHIIAAGVHRHAKRIGSVDDIFLPQQMGWAVCFMLMQRRPRTKIVPAEICR